MTGVDTIAAKSGLHVGDRIDIARMGPAERLRVGFLPLAPEGQVMVVMLTSGRAVSLRSHQYVRSAADNITDIIAVIALWAYIALAALLVLLRPTPATWAFYIFSFAFCNTGTLIFMFLPFASQIALDLIRFVATVASGAAFVSFALRFPDAQPAGWAKVFERVLLFGVAPTLVLWSVGRHFAYAYAAAVQPTWLTNFSGALQFGMYAAGVVILPVRYATANAANRNRLQLVVAAFAVAFLPTLVINFIEGTIGLFPEVSIINVAQAWELLAPIALAYTVLKHRLFDIRFVFSRALMYAIMTSLTVGVLALVDWAFARWLAESRFALIAELSLALLLGVSLTAAHRRLEGVLNKIMFRAQTLALQALRRFAQETDLIADPQRLLTQTYEALNARLESEYTAIYTADGSSFVLATAHAEAAPERAVRMRRAGTSAPRRPVRTHDRAYGAGRLHRLRSQTRSHALPSRGDRDAFHSSAPRRFRLRVADDATGV